MKHILLFGAGRSSGALIDYLIIEAANHDWQLVVADSNLEQAISKTRNAPHTSAVSLDVTKASERKLLVQVADIVISMLPPALHLNVALDCIELKKDLLTASYADKEIRQLEDSIRDRGLLFLYEMGLDPGIDHMSAMELIHRILSHGGQISSFKSHTGGLVAPESDDNPWHYKISWNPRNVVLAGSAGALYKEDGQIKKISYDAIFENCRPIHIKGAGPLAYYPNRDSLSYIPIYSLETANTFIRTTLRHPAYCEAWKTLVKAGLTNDKDPIEKMGMPLKEWSRKLTPFITPENRECLNFLGVFDLDAVPAHAQHSADILQYLLETKLSMQPNDKDQIIMSHEIEYATGGHAHRICSNLIVTGEDMRKTAMAKTVGLPVGIAAKLILQKKISLQGLHIPTIPAIYTPVLHELRALGIGFEEFLS